MLYLRMRQAEDQAKFAVAARLAEQQLALHKEVDAFDSVLYKMGDLNGNWENRRHLTGGYIMQNNERQAMIDGTDAGPWRSTPSEPSPMLAASLTIT